MTPIRIPDPPPAADDAAYQHSMEQSAIDRKWAEALHPLPDEDDRDAAQEAR